jgi:hypothetical protein
MIALPDDPVSLGSIVSLNVLRTQVHASVTGRQWCLVHVKMSLVFLPVYFDPSPKDAQSFVNLLAVQVDRIAVGVFMVVCLKDEIARPLV